MVTVSKDGTRIPGSGSGERTFKGDNGRRSKGKRMQTLMDKVCSILGRFCLSVRVRRVYVDRGRLTGEGLGRLGGVKVEGPIITIFSHNCPSLRFVSFLRARKVRCLVHLSSGSCVTRHGQVRSTSRGIVLGRSSTHLRGVQGGRPRQCRRVRGGKDALMEVSGLALPSKGRLTLVASLPSAVATRRLTSLCCRE